MLDPSSAPALSRWADLVMSAPQFEASADAICEREIMNSSLGSVRTLLEAAETLEVEGATLDELAGIHAKSHVRAEELAGAVGLLRQVLSVTDRDPAAGLDVRARPRPASERGPAPKQRTCDDCFGMSEKCSRRFRDAPKETGSPR